MPGYNPYNYVNPFSQPINYQIPQVQQPTQQIQDGGFVRVRNIDEARNWAVAPGNSVTFKVENSPYICTKTMGFSQLEQPKFELFRLVKEDEPEKKEPVSEYASRSELEKVQSEIEDIRNKIEHINADFAKKPQKLSLNDENEDTGA